MTPFMLVSFFVYNKNMKIRLADVAESAVAKVRSALCVRGVNMLKIDNLMN